MKYNLLLPAFAVIVTAAVAFGVNAFAAFTEPATAPPAGNAYAPLDTGPATNTKQGSLIVNGNVSTSNGYYSGGINVESSLNVDGNQVWNSAGNLYLNYSAPSATVVVGGNSINGTAIPQNLTLPDGTLDVYGNVNAYTGSFSGVCLNGSCISSWPTPSIYSGSGPWQSHGLIYYASATAYCPAGTLATGGGGVCQASSGGLPSLFSSQPDGPYAYSISCAADSSVDGPVQGPGATAYVYCIQ